MKLLIIWHAGGVKSYWKRYEELAGKFDEVKVLVPKVWNEGGKEIISEDNILLNNCSMIPCKTIFNFHDAIYSFKNKNLAKVLKEYRPDIIHIHEEPWSLSTVQVIMFNKLLSINAKVIIDSAAITIKKKFFPFSLFEKLSYKSANLIFARNNEVKSIISSRGYKGPIYTLPNGIDESKFKKFDLLTVNQMKDKIGLTRTEKVIGYIGRLVESKGIYDFIDSAENLINTYKVDNLKFVMIGNGEESDNVLKVIKAKKIEKRFLLIERVDSTEVALLMNCLDILVLPSKTKENWKEQFGRVLIEAMACEKVVIGSNSGAIPEVIDNKAFVFPEGDVNSLSSILINVLNDKNLYEKTIIENQQKAITRYSWKSLAEYYYEKIVGIIKVKR